MRKIIILCSFIALLASCKSKSKTAEKPLAATKVTVVKTEEINIEQRNKAYELGKRVLNTCNTSRFKAFNSSEAIPSVIENTTEAKLTKTCLKFRLKYGDFKDIKLIEVVHDKRNKLNIYRYKAEYSKKIANKELRVAMNEENKVTAIKSTDWIDKYKPLN